MATYYAVHNGPLGSGDGSSPANGMALQTAIDTATAGDTVLVCATGTYVPLTPIDFDTNSGTSNAWIRVAGASAAGAEDGTMPTISGSALGSNTNLFQFATATGYRFYDLQRLRLTGATRHNVNLSGNQRAIRFANCRIDNAIGNGFFTENASAYVLLYGCEVDHNGADGIGQFSSGQGNVIAVGCSVHHNTGYGINLGGTLGINLEGVLVYRNGNDGCLFNGSGLNTRVNAHSCTFDHNAGDGLSVSGAISLVRTNCIFSANDGYGVNFNEINIFGIGLCNLYYNNTLGDVDLAEGVALTDVDSITGSDPKFVSVTDGAENYALQADSPAKAAGYPGALPAGGTGYLDIGALQRQESTSGGGGEGVYPSEDDVQQGVSYGPTGSDYTGNFVPPAVGDVEDGVRYGAAGIEFEGTLELPAEKDVRVGVGYGAMGTEFEGTLVVEGGSSGGGGQLPDSHALLAATEVIKNVLSGVTSDEPGGTAGKIRSVYWGQGAPSEVARPFMACQVLDASRTGSVDGKNEWTINLKVRIVFRISRSGAHDDAFRYIAQVENLIDNMSPTTGIEGGEKSMWSITLPQEPRPGNEAYVESQLTFKVQTPRGGN